MAQSKRSGPEILGAAKRARVERDGADKASWLSLLGARLPARELALATDCGGSVGPVSALADLGVPFRHIFACESDPSSQQLLASQDSRPERLFGSMIGRDRGCYCLVSGRWMPMPKVQPDIYISNAGTHGPNPDRFFAAVKYIMEYQPRVVILEDLVAACRQDPQGNLPADAILALLEQAGDYEVDAYQVLASNYGLPQRRQRVYYVMVGRQFLRPSRRSGQAPDAEARLERVREGLEQLHVNVAGASQSLDAEDLLSELDGPTLCCRLNSDASDASDGSGSSAIDEATKGIESLLAMSADASYLHRRLRHELRLAADDLTYFSEAGPQLAKWLRTYREADLCQIHWLRARSQGREIRFVSISQDAHRASLSFTGEIPTLAANTRLWSYRLQRVLRGQEMMMLQGFKPLHWRLGSLSESTISRIAGSAMSVHMIAAILAAVLASVDLKAPVQEARRRTISLAELRSRYAGIRQRLNGLRRHARLGA
ncbi:CHT1 [Symbiodinium natans]|uniref:CHT1 protein n=1 Tax=Symbiodinium natans TaxID=878477 RepID=A0A812LKG5_9DINO|nr:CHT1 [Symbiodinium natans]